MKIKWYGQACFWIESSHGVKIVTDPYTPETAGFRPIAARPDIVITSSDNDLFHCRHDLVPGPHLWIDALKTASANGGPIGSQTSHGITVSAIQAMEALDHKFHDPDQNGMYKFEVDGVMVGHMGDMGNALTPAQTDFFQGVDVLLALAGGHPVIELDALKNLIDATQPKLVIPMHFRTLRYKPRNMFWIDKFLSYFDNAIVDFACDCEVTVMRDLLPKQMRVCVLDTV
jgi:L-ascorbate metabolism protein UlaG (beta-lactamase superfamily)